MIPRFSDSEKDPEDLCKLVLSLEPSVEKISLLPYHKFAELKQDAMGKLHPWKGVPTISDERIGAFKELVESRGIEVDAGR